MACHLPMLAGGTSTESSEPWSYTVQLGPEKGCQQMGIFDKAKEFVAEHDDEVEKAIDKVADVVENKVPEKNKAKVSEVAEKAKGFVDKLDSTPKTNKPA